MKRWFSSLALASVTAACMAQSFTIARPADGSRVREKVHILIPYGSIPPSGYVGVFLNGKLLEAVVPPRAGKYYDYVLDTKGREIPDTAPGTPDKLEVVLYTDYNDQSRIVDRSSVNVYIGNKANIQVPNAGIKLRYKFVPDTQLIYQMDQHVITSQQSEQQRKMNAKAAQFDTEGEKIRLMYAVDNAYSGGDGLLQIQPLTPQGKNYADFTLLGQSAPERFSVDELTPIYMRVSDTGHEVFGALPPYLPLQGSSAASSVTRHLYGDFPLPSLPYKAVRPGDAWQANFQMPDLNLTYDLTSAVKQVPARGEFVDVEWEHGHPCALIRNTVEAADLDKILASADAAATPAADGTKTEPSRFSLNEQVWFALDTHQVVKVVRDLSLDLKSSVMNTNGGGAPGVGGPPGGFPGGFPGGPPGGFPRGGKFGGGGGMGSGGAGAGSIIPGQHSLQFGAGKRGGGFGAPGTGMGGGFPGAGSQGRMGSSGPGANNVFTRVRIVETYTLEKVRRG